MRQIFWVLIFFLIFVINIFLVILNIETIFILGIRPIYIIPMLIVHGFMGFWVGRLVIDLIKQIKIKK